MGTFWVNKDIFSNYTQVWKDKTFFLIPAVSKTSWGGQIFFDKVGSFLESLLKKWGLFRKPEQLLDMRTICLVVTLRTIFWEHHFWTNDILIGMGQNIAPFWKVGSIIWLLEKLTFVLSSLSGHSVKMKTFWCLLRNIFEKTWTFRQQKDFFLDLMSSEAVGVFRRTNVCLLPLLQHKIWPTCRLRGFTVKHNQRAHVEINKGVF